MQCSCSLMPDRDKGGKGLKARGKKKKKQAHVARAVSRCVSSQCWPKPLCTDARSTLGVPHMTRTTMMTMARGGILVISTLADLQLRAQNLLPDDLVNLEEATPLELEAWGHLRSFYQSVYHLSLSLLPSCTSLTRSGTVSRCSLRASPVTE